MGSTRTRFMPGSSSWARPDRSMAHERYDDPQQPARITSAMRQVFKRAAAKKRRQRDRSESTNSQTSE